MSPVEPIARRSAGHRPDALSLIFGVLFLGSAALFGLTDGGEGLPGEQWYLPALLVLAGGLGLVASLLRRPPSDQR